MNNNLKKPFINKNNTFNNKAITGEILFKINNNIICQRIFPIEFFNKESLQSIDLKYAIDDVVNIINNDLKSKTLTYMFNTCFTRDNEEQEKNTKINLLSGKRENDEDVITDYNDFWVFLNKSNEFIPTKNEKNIMETYFKTGWCKEVKREGTGFYNKPKEINGLKTFLHNYENVFYFSFKIKGEEVISKIWSADDYPSFVRNGVDITNKIPIKGQTESEFSYNMKKMLFMNRKDLVPQIITILTNVCQ